MKKIINKEKLIKDIFKWVVKGAVADNAKEKLLKVMIEATLDYLYMKGFLNKDKNVK